MTAGWQAALAAGVYLVLEVPQGLKPPMFLGSSAGLKACSTQVSGQFWLLNRLVHLWAALPPNGLRRYSMPSCLRAAGLRRSGVHCGSQTTLAWAVRTPSIRSIRLLTCSPIMV